MEIDSIIGEMPKLVDGFVANIMSYALILAAVATITMTFLELFKALLNLRLKYHKRKVEAWLSNDLCFEELLILTVAGIDTANALFDQPTDKMMGQIQSATNVVIDFPDLYPKMYHFLTTVPSSRAAADITGRTGTTDNINFHFKDDKIWYDFVTRQTINKADGPSEGEIQIATKARARIDHFIARKLDAFQSRTEYQWARRNQFLSVGASFIFLLILLTYLHVPILLGTILSFFGGMMAPFAKDVVSALSGLRTK